MRFVVSKLMKISANEAASIANQFVNDNQQMSCLNLTPGECFKQA